MHGSTDLSKYIYDLLLKSNKITGVISCVEVISCNERDVTINGLKSSRTNSLLFSFFKVFQ